MDLEAIKSETQKYHQNINRCRLQSCCLESCNFLSLLLITVVVLTRVFKIWLLSQRHVRYEGLFTVSANVSVCIFFRWCLVPLKSMVPFVSIIANVTAYAHCENTLNVSHMRWQAQYFNWVCFNFCMVPTFSWLSSIFFSFSSIFSVFYLTNLINTKIYLINL